MRYVYIAYEDILQKECLKRILDYINPEIFISKDYTGGGNEYIKRMISPLNKLASINPQIPIIVLTDLDRYQCPISLISTWLPEKISENLFFRVAVYEIESWILADRDNLSLLLKISKSIIPKDVECVVSPKEKLIELAKRSSKPMIRNNIIPRNGSTARIGRGYNEIFVRFIQNSWDIDNARLNSSSLDRLIRRLSADL